MDANDIDHRASWKQKLDLTRQRFSTKMKGKQKKVERPCGTRPYTYQPINGSREIRLLQVLDHKSSRIRCSIDTYQRDTAPFYLAISYTWGDGVQSETILCGEEEHLIVTKNCCRALHSTSFSFSLSTMMIWIDAICIDQSNVVEKNAQVAIMGDIYRNAGRTLIVPGDPDPNAFESYQIDTNKINDHLEVTEGILYKQPEHVRHDLNAICLVDGFFTSPWFTRMWVIQELLLSKSPFIVVGDEHISWWAVIRCWMAGSQVPYIVGLNCELKQAYGHISHAPNSSLETNWSLVKPIPYWNLLDMLNDTRPFKCSDPRDRIFALIPLFEKPTPKSLLPDYSKSLEEVYINIANYFFQYDVKEVLAHASGEYPGNELPTWVPDWRVNPPPSMTQYYDSACAGDVEGSRRIVSRHHGRCLFLRGVIVDLVKSVKAISRESRSIWQDMKTIDGYDARTATSARPGDALCALVGFPMIIVLRQKGDSWRVVCDAIVKGFMRGEALTDFTWADVEGESFPDDSKLREFEIW